MAETQTQTQPKTGAKTERRVTFAPDVRGGDNDATEKTDAPELRGRLEALKLKRRREALRRDLQCQLLVERVSQDTFKQALLQLKPGDYHEVVVERALDKLCGYPLCSNPVGDWSALPRKKISWRDKAIYDKSKLKDFCSISCMNKSEAIEESLPLLKEGSISTEARAQAVVLETKRETVQEAVCSFPSPGSVTSAMMVEGFRTATENEGFETSGKVEHIATPPKAPRKEAPAESKAAVGSEKGGMEDLINEMLTSPEQIAEDVGQFKLGSFLKLWSALSDFVDTKIDDRKDYPTLESVEFDDFTGRRQVLRGHLVRAAGAVLEDVPSLAEVFTRQYISQLVVEGAGSFNISRPVSSLSVQEWKLLVVLLLEVVLRQFSLPSERTNQLNDLKAGLFHSLSITAREGTLLADKLLQTDTHSSPTA